MSKANETPTEGKGRETSRFPVEEGSESASVGKPWVSKERGGSNHMDFKDTPYFRVGRASDLEGRDRFLYRILEILPGTLSWATLVGTVILSYFAPIYAAYFIIAFDLYWLLKTIYLSIHLRYNWRRIKNNLATDWTAALKNMKHDHVTHMVIFPFFKESFEVVENSVKSIVDSDYDKSKIILVLAAEEKAGQEAKEIASFIQKKYGNLFKHFLSTIHPAGLAGEMPGKGSNIAYAAEQARLQILDPNNISYRNTLVSAFDVDTVVYPKYFSCLTWYFLTTPNPMRVSFQPVPFYNNNIWQAPALSRVVATSSTFWQMVQQERPEKLSTFSSHAVCFQQLYEIGYWQKNMVSEDSRIFWNLFLANNGDYRVVPISYPVSMDANLAPKFFQTIKNIYKQHRRWTWGVENVPYLLMGFIKNKKIPLWKKIKTSFVQLEGFWSLATNPIMIFLLGWLPILIGGRKFNATVLSYNLPFITRDLMILSMAGLFLSAAISWSFLPSRPQGYGKGSSLMMILQWILVPITITVFGAIPGLDAQTRLMTGRYLGFWVTPKHRKNLEILPQKISPISISSQKKFISK